MIWFLTALCVVCGVFLKWPFLHLCVISTGDRVEVCSISIPPEFSGELKITKPLKYIVHFKLWSASELKCSFYQTWLMGFHQSLDKEDFEVWWLCGCFKINRWYVKDCSLNAQILCSFKQSGRNAAFRAGYRRKPMGNSRRWNHTAFQLACRLVMIFSFFHCSVNKHTPFFSIVSQSIDQTILLPVLLKKVLLALFSLTIKKSIYIYKCLTQPWWSKRCNKYFLWSSYTSVQTIHLFFC